MYSLLVLILGGGDGLWCHNYAPSSNKVWSVTDSDKVGLMGSYLLTTFLG